MALLFHLRDKFMINFHKICKQMTLMNCFNSLSYYFQLYIFVSSLIEYIEHIDKIFFNSNFFYSY